MTWLAVALGGALGALARYTISTYWLTPSSGVFPWGTFTANVLGAALMGICYVLIVEKGVLSSELRPLFMVGFLGALTTFSTFSLDTWLLWQQGQSLLAMLYSVGSLVLCMLSLSISIFFVRMI